MTNIIFKFVLLNIKRLSNNTSIFLSFASSMYLSSFVLESIFPFLWLLRWNKHVDLPVVSQIINSVLIIMCSVGIGLLCGKKVTIRAMHLNFHSRARNVFVMWSTIIFRQMLSLQGSKRHSTRYFCACLLCPRKPLWNKWQQRFCKHKIHCFSFNKRNHETLNKSQYWISM